MPAKHQTITAHRACLELVSEEGREGERAGERERVQTDELETEEMNSEGGKEE